MLDALRSGNHNLATGTDSSAAARKWQHMTAEESRWEIPEPSKSVINWLLDSDPASRWQVMRDLLDEPHAVVAGERSRVALEGWGSRLLGLQGSDGQWVGGSYVFPGWISTTDTLLLLRDLGLDPASEQARKAIGLVRDNCTWGPEFGDTPFFEGEVELIDPNWTKFSFPTRWHYDVLWGLDYLRRAGFEPDERVGEAIDLVGKKQDGDRRWPLENPPCR
jgi:hypothetical protein